MSKNKGFTLTEILIAVAIAIALFGISYVLYSRTTEKAKSAEALINIHAIKTAEEVHEATTGQYIAAENNDQINDLLGLGIEPKYYDYKVIVPYEDNYLVIAQRKGLDVQAALASGRPMGESLVVAMDRSGIVHSDLGVYLGNGGYWDKSGSSADSSGGGGGSVIVMGPTGPETIVAGGGSSGSSSTGGSGGSSGSGTGTTGTGTGSGSGEGGGGGGSYSARTVVYNADINIALTKLSGSATGAYYCNLIQENNIDVSFEDFFQYGLSPGVLAFWVSSYNDPDDVANAGLEFNKIYINEWLKSRLPDSAIAAIICHEATHADYDYYPQKWIDATLAQHPDLTEDDLHITAAPNNSIDQEFNAHVNQINVWKEIKGDDVEMMHDTLESYYDQGDDYLWDYVAATYGLLPDDPYGLPAY